MGIKRLSYEDMAHIADPKTDIRLLPSSMWPRDNGRRLRHYCIAVTEAMKDCITPLQREQLNLHYNRGLPKAQIARLQNKGASAVTKSMRAGEEAIRKYAEMYMRIYDRLEQEELQEE